MLLGLVFATSGQIQLLSPGADAGLSGAAPETAVKPR
jgi:hypothetical protein